MTDQAVTDLMDRLLESLALKRSDDTMSKPEVFDWLLDVRNLYDRHNQTAEVMLLDLVMLRIPQGERSMYPVRELRDILEAARNEWSSE